MLVRPSPTVAVRASVSTLIRWNGFYCPVHAKDVVHHRGNA